MGIKSISLGVIALILSTSVKAAIVYDINRTIETGTVTGFIETDGTLGVLTSANITNWVLTLSSPTETTEINFANQNQTYLAGAGTVATATQLAFDFNTSSGWFLLQGPTGFWCLEIAGCSVRGYGETMQLVGNTHTEYFHDGSATGLIMFAEVAAVPVPAAVWLFGSGLISLIGVARRKKA